MPPRTRTMRQKKRVEEGTIRNTGKQKRKQIEEAESCGRPCSARKCLVTESAMIHSRRTSLRSAKRIIETKITSAARCLQPQESSEHSSDSDFVFEQEYQVMAFSLVESSSEYLRQVAHPSTMAPEMIHEENEGSFTVEVLEMEEVREADKSLPNHSNQMEGQSMVKAECIPLEQVPLAKETQTSNNIEKRTNKNPSKLASPCFSLNLTEMVNMWHDEDDDVNSAGQSLPIDTVHGYQVKPESMSILREIIRKHGDIAKDSTMLTLKYRSKLLEMVCDIISKLQEKDFSKIKEDDLRETLALVNDIKSAKVDIEWLHLRLVEILEARETLKLSGMLKRKKESNKRIIENAKRELGEFEAKKKAVEAKLQSIYDKEAVCKETLAKARDEYDKITTNITYAKSKVKRFLNCSLDDGLL